MRVAAAAETVPQISGSDPLPTEPAENPSPGRSAGIPAGLRTQFRTIFENGTLGQAGSPLALSPEGDPDPNLAIGGNDALRKSAPCVLQPDSECGLDEDTFSSEIVLDIPVADVKCVAVAIPNSCPSIAAGESDQEEFLPHRVAVSANAPTMVGTIPPLPGVGDVSYEQSGIDLSLSPSAVPDTGGQIDGGTAEESGGNGDEATPSIMSAKQTAAAQADLQFDRILLAQAEENSSFRAVNDPNFTFGKAKPIAPNDGLIQRIVSSEVVRQVGNVTVGTAEKIVEIRLDPPELGRLRLSVEISGNSVQALVAVERPEISDLMRRNAESLTRELIALGFENVRLEFRHESNFQQHAETKNTELAHVFGDLDTADSEAAEAAAGSSMHPHTGLDIRL